MVLDSPPLRELPLSPPLSQLATPPTLPAEGAFDNALEHADVTVTHGEGSRPPIFAIRSWHDECAHYQRLARHLGPEQPLYTIGPPAGECNEDFPLDCDAWTALCVERLLPHLPPAPFYLMGWSFGGILALESARKLAERGISTERVVMVDSQIPRAAAGRTRYRSVLHRAAFHTNALLEMPPSRRGPYVVDRARRRWLRARRRLDTFRARTTGPSTDPSLRDRHTGVGPAGEDLPLLLRAVWRNYSRFRAAATEQDVTLLWCEESRIKVGDTALGWLPYLRGSVELLPIPGAHMSVFEEPHVAAVAACVRQAVRPAP